VVHAEGAPALADQTPLERESLDRLRRSAAWPHRAIAAMRLERFGCSASQDELEALVNDASWQVRAFALRALARRRAPGEDHWLAGQTDLRVIRTGLRHRFTFDEGRLTSAIEYLARSEDLRNKMLAVELACAAGGEQRIALADETIRKIILRMNRAEAGILSPRLAAVTGARGLRRDYHWQQWLRKQGRDLGLRGAWGVPEGDSPFEPSLIASIEPQRFAELEGYLVSLGRRHLELALVIDCTGSMSGELSAVQGGMDDLLLYLRDVSASARVGLVAYRDRNNEFETKWWDFTGDLDEARRRLWSLSANEGGDTEEAVYPAMRDALEHLSWTIEHAKVLVLIGDAPPHVGYGKHCVELAARGARGGLVTHTILAEGEPVKHFAEIATAGSGRCVALEDDDALTAEIAGLALGDRFERELREFFAVYLELCR
jgi:hypothetical protein